MTIVNDRDAHRTNIEEAPKVLLDSGEIVSVTKVEPIIDQILSTSKKKQAVDSYPQRS